MIKKQYPYKQYLFCFRFLVEIQKAKTENEQKHEKAD